MPNVTEIAPDIYRISVFYPEINLGFNHFLVKDDEPLLFHTGLRRMFAEVLEGVSKVLDPAMLRWISWSHFESDECGSLNDWLAVAPNAQPACGMIGALVSVNDFSKREARILNPNDVLATGKYRFRYYQTPQLPHGWDAGVVRGDTADLVLFRPVSPRRRCAAADRIQHHRTGAPDSARISGRTAGELCPLHAEYRCDFARPGIA